MLKSLILIGCVTGLVFIAGCSEQKETQSQNTKIIRTTVSYGVNIWCDKETNIEYLIFKEYRAGGITPRIGADGKFKKCLINVSSTFKDTF